MMLVEMMKYMQVADERVIAVFGQNAIISAKAVSLFSHVLNAQHIWANRILDRPSLYGVWQEHSPEAFSSISIGNMECFQYILENIDLSKQITYRNSTGGTFTNVVKDVLIHVFNHSTYHRGQVASLFKADGILPPVTDYIMLKREMHL